jgi:hypothetical protein
MTADYVYPTVPKPLRVLVLGAAEPAWYLEDDGARRDAVLPAFMECFRMINEELGARCITTFDDDLLMAGTPRSKHWSFYLVYEAPDLDVVTAMVNMFRMPINGVRLDRYFRVEAIVGRAFFPAEPAGMA